MAVLPLPCPAAAMRLELRARPKGDISRMGVATGCRKDRELTTGCGKEKLGERIDGCYHRLQERQGSGHKLLNRMVITPVVGQAEASNPPHPLSSLTHKPTTQQSWQQVTPVGRAS
eukprot:1161405-Pelagomonas_calceolata.AAC.9